MKRVYASADPVECGLMESVLKSAGIECLVRNRYLGGAVGELPVNESWPEIWVVDERDLAAAERLIANVRTPREGGRDWRCPRCGEHIEAQFDQCWQCGAEAPDD
ncbi:MAG: putative signal transducing protein [Gammaproteobacteria bacterium]